jgi:thioredoxin reductase
MNETGAYRRAAFPRLDDADITALTTIAARRRLRDGERLFEAGGQRGGFFVVLAGAVEIVHHSGDEPQVEIENMRMSERRRAATPAVFSFIGANPRTGWLPPQIETDAKGFIRTGQAIAGFSHWTLERAPFLLETSRPGGFAAGDVRLGSIKRVSSAVGEGAMAIEYIHEYLADQQP